MTVISDPVVLSGVKFAFTVLFHILWPVLAIGLAWFLLGWTVRVGLRGRFTTEHIVKQRRLLVAGFASILSRTFRQGSEMQEMRSPGRDYGHA